MGQTIGIVSLKGGVGKTTTLVSLGAALSELGKKVLLIDGNLSAPNLGMHLNILDTENTVHDVLNQTSKTLDSIYPFDSNGISFDVMPATIFGRIEVNPLKLKNRIRGLKRKYDMILIDSSPSLREDTLAVMLASDSVIFVATPDRPTLGTTLKSIRLARKRGVSIAGLILNKVHGKNFETSFDDAQETLEVPVLAVIPHDVNMLKALSEMRPYTSIKKNSPGVVEFKKLAAVLSGEKYRQNTLKDFFRKLTPSRQEINREVFYKRVFE